jgi:hypothetical protein
MTEELEPKSGRLYSMPGEEYFAYYVEDLDHIASQTLRAAIADESYVMGVVLPARKVVWSSQCQRHINLAAAERVNYVNDALARFQTDRTLGGVRVQADVLNLDTADLLAKFLQPVIPLSATFNIRQVDTFFRKN